jgi:hypothetical protein
MFNRLLGNVNLVRYYNYYQMITIFLLSVISDVRYNEVLLYPSRDSRQSSQVFVAWEVIRSDVAGRGVHFRSEF